jgi:hypothetical protein
VLRETHAASDRKQNRTAGLQGGGDLRPKNDLQAKPTHCVSHRARGPLHPKRGSDSPVRPQARGKPGENRTFREAWIRGDRGSPKRRYCELVVALPDRHGIHVSIERTV